MPSLPGGASSEPQKGGDSTQAISPSRALPFSPHEHRCAGNKHAARNAVACTRAIASCSALLCTVSPFVVLCVAVGVGLACCCIVGMRRLGHWVCQWQNWHGDLLREGRWCRHWLGDDWVELWGCRLPQLLQMGIAHAREVTFLRPRGPQSRQSLALKSVWPRGRRRCKQNSQRIHPLDLVTGKQAGGTSLNADVQLSFVVPLACRTLMSAAHDALPREEITEQDRGGSLRIQWHQQVTKALIPTCLSSSTCETSGTTPLPPPTQSTPSTVGWTPTHPPGSFGSPTFPPTPPSAGLSTPSFFHPPSQGAFTPPVPHRPTPPSQTTTPQSL